MMEPYLFLSYKKATILKVKHKKYCHRRAYFSFRHCQVFILPLSLPKLFFMSFPCLARESKRDVRVKPEHDIEKEAEHDYKEKEAEHNKEKSPLI